MYFDNVTIAGVLAASLYGLLPLLFRGEFLRVNEDLAGRRPALPGMSDFATRRRRPQGRGEQPAPCAS
jgi:hypothetical protein